MAVKIILLIAGLVFPLISWLTFIGCTLQAAITKKYSSGVYIPFIGPILLDCWILSAGYSPWYLLIPWVADIGTIIFLMAAPGIIKEIWSISRFTMLFKLLSVKENITVEISFHRNGIYLLEKKWDRPKNEIGITIASEGGKYVTEQDDLLLQSHTGRVRRLLWDGQNYICEDEGPANDYEIAAWVFQRR
ncbi:MAG: hypothetical protein PHF29_05715 [Candidatus Riflebacteria bacterium]|nr:hypothetical protein [Candidatus Riflebacteria bacterium]